MKKRIIVLVISLLLMTGCTCEYNLTIDNSNYQESISINGTTNDEIIHFNNDWKVPIDKNEYNNISGEPGTKVEIDTDIYQYKLTGNNLTFTNDFTKSNLNNSTAISICYDKVTIQNYEDSIIISTSNKVQCFNKYPSLTNIKINITTDKPVKKHNADSVNKNTYTWNISQNDSESKPINMIINNKYSEPSKESQSSQTDNKNNKKDYSLYILCGILLIIVLIGYLIIKKIKKNSDDMDE